ncbi:hypothetical protein ABW20_dc0104793 [Dactylellina cionopaga]|nr:hypothetical protein ABW20_dc0104793 [Dactylellina cionopaga]
MRPCSSSSAGCLRLQARELPVNEQPGDNDDVDDGANDESEEQANGDGDGSNDQTLVLLAVAAALANTCLDVVGDSVDGIVEVCFPSAEHVVLVYDGTGFGRRAWVRERGPHR